VPPPPPPPPLPCRNPWAAAPIVVAALAPALLYAAVHDAWSHASAAGAVEAQRRVFGAVLRHAFTDRVVAGMNTFAIGQRAVAALQPVSEVRTAPRESVRTATPPAPVDRKSGAEGPDGGPAIVLLHGFMSGGAMYVNNLDALAATGRPVYVLDWRSCAGSPREAAAFPAHGHAEDYFVTALEQWRRAVGAATLDIVGHSMGGYIATSYALRHPDRVNKLVLVSPGGLPTIPNPSGPLAAAVHDGMIWVWRRLSPSFLLRALGPLGWCVMAGVWAVKKGQYPATRAMGAAVWWQLAHYLFHINAAPHSAGDAAAQRFFAPGLRSAAPIGERLLAAVRSKPHDGVAPIADRIRFPITLLYGGAGRDWMVNPHIDAVVAQLTGAGLHVALHRVEAGGHDLYAECPADFNTITLHALGLS